MYCTLRTVVHFTWEICALAVPLKLVQRGYKYVCMYMYVCCMLCSCGIGTSVHGFVACFDVSSPPTPLPPPLRVEGRDYIENEGC